MLECLAAEHYRRWADGLSDPAQKRNFLAAAARAEHIAEVLGNLEPKAEHLTRTLWQRFPNLRTLYADAIRPLGREEQWQVQSIGEHGGQSRSEPWIRILK